MKKFLLSIYLTIVGLAFVGWMILGTFGYYIFIAFTTPELSDGKEFFQALFTFTMGFAILTPIYGIVTFSSFDALRAVRKLWKNKKLSILNKLTMIIAPILLTLAWSIFVRIIDFKDFF